MTDLLSLYQHLPEHLNPIAFIIGFFAVKWYSIMYLIGLAVVYGLLNLRKRELQNEESQKAKGKSQNFGVRFTPDFIFDFLIYVFVGLLIGGRLGYVLFYNSDFFLEHPSSVILPYDFSSNEWLGISGMSYHGGVLGILLAALFFARKNKLNFWAWADFVVPAIPAGYFFGRLGNFLNGELYGRVTERFWGMYFPEGGLFLRHPSQLYEAFFEGAVLFVILWALRNKKNMVGHFLALYIFGYGAVRFLLEFFREPDAQIGLLGAGLTLGQIFSLLMIAFAAALFFGKTGKRGYNGS